jgi:hypothetical protein
MNWKSELEIVYLEIFAKRAIIPQVAKFDNRPAACVQTGLRPCDRGLI